jgi:hypothetical protein
LGDGDEIRYAIENYLLDPLLVGLLLIAIGKKQFGDFGVTTKTSYFEIPRIDRIEAQAIIDGMLFCLDKRSEQKRNYTLYNGWVVQTAESVFTQNGHELECLYKEKIPSLKLFNNDGQADKNMKLQIIEKIIKDVRGLLPKAVLDTLRKIE